MVTTRLSERCREMSASTSTRIMNAASVRGGDQAAHRLFIPDPLYLRQVWSEPSNNGVAEDQLFDQLGRDLLRVPQVQSLALHFRPGSDGAFELLGDLGPLSLARQQEDVPCVRFAIERLSQIAVRLRHRALKITARIRVLGDYPAVVADCVDHAANGIADQIGPLMVQRHLEQGVQK
jgi:hypothetical protein